MRIKAKAKKGVVTVKAMAKHPMLGHKEAAKKKKKANWITHMVATVNGETVYEVNMSQFVSKNPYVKFAFDGKKGDAVEITWSDMSGEKKVSKGKIK